MKPFKIALFVYICCIIFSMKSVGSLEPTADCCNRSLYEEKEKVSKVGLKNSCTCHGCGAVPYPTSNGYVTPAPILDSSLVWNFVSEPNLHPLKVIINVFEPGTSSGYIFIAPYGFSDQSMYGQSGSLILDNLGDPIWFRPLGSPNLMNTDFRRQTYKGKPVLTFWQGTLATPPAYTNAPGGSSEPGSCYYILDNTYAVIKNVRARRGFTSDIHEFLLTPCNTALFLSTKVVPMDLTPFGGPKDGYVQDFAIQEVDLDTNKLVFFWDALDHIPLSESYVSASSAVESGNIWDAYHLNSIGLTNNIDEIILSSRSCWTIYKIHKPTKKILWKLGGKNSSFTIESGAEFSWQHDARSLAKNLISLFDDNSNGESPSVISSHGLILELDFQSMTASLCRSYFHDPNLTVASQGNVQSLDNGNKFVGWGQSQYYSEFREKGNTESNPSVNFLYDAAMPTNDYSYRAYRNDWVGRPYYPPSIGVAINEGQVSVYASWNGSTETTHWQIYSGNNYKKLSKVITVPKSGFETTVHIDNKGPYYQVRALNDKGKVISVSKIIKLIKI